MATSMTTRNASTRSLNAPIAAFAVSSALLVTAILVHNLPAVTSKAPLDHLVQLLPSALLVVVLVVALFAGSRLRLALTAFAVAVTVRFAGPVLVDSIPSVGIPDVVWTGEDPDGYVWVNEIFAGTNETVRLGGFAVLAATALIIFCVIWLGLVLRPALAAPALRSSFGIDSTLLILVFAVGGALSWTSSYGADFNPSEPFAVFSSGDLWVLTRTIVWVLPLVLWLAFTCRRGGALAVGGTAGAFTAVALIPWAMDRLAEVLGGPRSVLAFEGSIDQAGVVSGYEAFDVLGTSPLVIIPSSALLLVTLWWALSHHASVECARVTAPAGSPVSGLAVSAFVLAWIPLTCLPAIVLGHMAYDQVSTSEVQQRGIGLARWSIVLAYLTLGGTAFFVMNTWIR